MRFVHAIALLFFEFLGTTAVSPPAVPPASGPHTLRVAAPAIAWIEAGSFTRGSSDDEIAEAVALCERTSPLPEVRELCHPEFFAAERPEQRVHLAAYGIDRFEVTVAAHRRCVAAGACTPSRVSADDERLSQEAHPVTGVTHRQALRYCRFVGGRLPTEAEWEHAARGDDGRTFPWGDVYNDRLANHGIGFNRPDDIDGARYAARVGSHPSAVSPYGVHDLAGNVWEWTADLYAHDAYAAGTVVHPTGAMTGGDRVVRGGSWRSPAFTMRSAYRFRVGEGGTAPDLGFRCAYDPP